MVEETHSNSPVIYKKWTKTSNVQRFLSLGAWIEAKKASIDIGIVEGAGLKSATKCWVDIFELATFLRSVATNVASGTTGESKMWYGGKVTDGKPVSRVFSIKYWGQQGQDQPDTNAFVFQCAAMDGVSTSSGAIMPVKPNKIISNDSIKVARSELMVMSYCLDLFLTGQASQIQWSDD